MIVVTSFFVACWMPFQFWSVVVLCGPILPSPTLYHAFSVIASINLCANPFIYASGQYRHLATSCVGWLCRLIRRENRVAELSVQQAGTGTNRLTTNT